MTATNSSPLINIDDVVEAMHANWSHLLHDQEYKLEHLVGKERWLATPVGHRKQLGVPFKALARQGELPVSWVRSKDDNNNVYVLK
jgi:hypothetical protein